MNKPDYFGLLTDDLLVHIMSLIRDCTTKELIRTTSTISTRWRNLWSLVPRLVFEEQKDVVNPYDLHPYIAFINNTINQCPTYPDLKKFKIHTIYDSSINPEFKTHFNNWIHYAISRKVDDFDLEILDFRGGEFAYDDQLFYNSPCITRIKLSWCIFSPPNGVIHWERLHSLCISHGILDEHMLQKILSGSPSLQTLELELCYGYKLIDVTSKSVKKLVFSGYNSDGWIFTNRPNMDMPYIDCVKINAPCIRSLTIKGDLGLRELALLNVSSLVEADLDYWIDLGEESRKEIHRGLLESLKHVKDVTFGDDILKIPSY